MRFRSEDLIIPESMAQDFGFTVMLEKQAHSGLRCVFVVRLWGQKTSQTRVLLNFRSLYKAQRKMIVLCALYTSVINGFLTSPL